MTEAIPEISVVVPIYNGAVYLEDALQSIEAQNVMVEAIVVDDGSTDDTRTLCARMPERIRYHRQENRGPAAARNQGIAMARARLLAFLDVDDVWTPEALRRLMHHLAAEPDADVAAGKIQLMTRKPDSPGGFESFGPQFHSYSLGTGVFRRSVFDIVGTFDETLRHGEDVDWFLRAREAGIQIRFVESLTLLYRRHGENMTFGTQSDASTLLKMLRRSIHRRREGAESSDRVPRFPEHEDS